MGMFPPVQVPGEDLQVLVLMWLLVCFLEGERAFVWYVKIIHILFTSLELPKNTLPAGVSNSMVSERIPSLLRRGRGADLCSQAEVPWALWRPHRAALSLRECSSHHPTPCHMTQVLFKIQSC